MKINLKNQKVPLKIKQPKYLDNRGYFQEIFLNKKFNLKIKFTAVAKSKKNVIRGLHFQKKNQQTKLIHVTEGKILDIVINLKKNSKYFGKVSRFILNEGDILFVPKFYAHGYECLTKKCTIFYHLEKYRDAMNESGISFKDKKIVNIWKTKKPIVSKRDKTLNSFKYFQIKNKSL